MENIFFEITVILAIASILAIIFRIFRQPAILAYIVTGIIIGPFGQFQLQNGEVLKAMGEFGIALLLFILGLEFRLGELRIVGKSSLFIGVAQLFITSILGYGIVHFFGFSTMSALYMSIGMALSSTVFVVTLMSDAKNLTSALTSAHAKLTIGILLVQDIVAVLALMLLSGSTSFEPGFALLRGIMLFAFVLLVSKTMLPRVARLLSDMPDTLFLCSLAWAFGLSLVASSSLVGMPIAIGGFLAGISLSNVVHSQHIVARGRTLRDFFMIMFFVTLGMQTGIGSVQSFFPIIALTVFVLVGKPLIVMAIMTIMGHSRKTAFLTGLSLGQISEFSLLLMLLGVRLHHVSQEITSIFTFVGIVSFLFSTYAITYGEQLYIRLEAFLHDIKVSFQ